MTQKNKTRFFNHHENEEGKLDIEAIDGKLLYDKINSIPSMLSAARRVKGN